jgi:hypothetical protein
MTANGANEDASQKCTATCAKALNAVTKLGHLFIDDKRLIISEYCSNLNAGGEPGPGELFLKWLFTNEWNPQRVTRVKITPRIGHQGEFEELSDPPGDIAYDPSDTKFLAVSASHPEHPPILQALDTKWWGWQEALSASGIEIHFLCPDEIENKYQRKMRR